MDGKEVVLEFLRVLVENIENDQYFDVQGDYHISRIMGENKINLSMNLTYSTKKG